MNDKKYQEMSDKHYNNIAQAIADAMDKMGFGQALGLVETIKIDMQNQFTKDYIGQHLNEN